MIEDENKLIDITDDLVNGVINRRLNAMSDISLTLQNKDGQYTVKNIIQPMDRIIVRMSRVGSPILVFSGFVDDAPYYQQYPGTVTLSASCTLKLLHNTYFDPGLIAIVNWFYTHGWTYDPNTGTLGVYQKGGVGNDDFYGNMKHIIEAMLIEFAGWPQDAITIYSLPSTFLQNIGNLMQDASNSSQQIYAKTLDILNRLYGSQPGTTTATPPVGSGASPSNTPNTGNVAAQQAAALALDAGFTGDDAVVAVAIAMAESSLITNNMHYNSNKTYDTGLWQVNSVHTPMGTNLPAPPHGVNTLQMPQDWNAVKGSIEPAVVNYIESLWDPGVNARAAHGLFTGNGNSFSGVWSTFDNGAYKQGNNLQVAQAAVLAAEAGGGGNPFQDPTVDVKRQPTTNTGSYGLLASPSLNFAGVDQGIDFTGTGKLYAVADGIVTNIHTATFEEGFTGLWLVLKIAGERFIYYSEAVALASGIREGSVLKKGDVIGTVDSTYPGCEVGWANADGSPQAPLPPARPASQFTQSGADFQAWVLNGGDAGSAPPGTTGGAGGAGGTGGVSPPQTTSAGGMDPNQLVINDNTLTIGQIAQLGAQSSFYTMQFQTSDLTLAESLTGERSLSNCMPIMEWLDTAIQASGRVYCSSPTGAFLSFFPDRFGFFDRTPYFHINDIEIIDLNINKNDTNLTTHVFTAGPLFPEAGINLWSRMNSMVASIEDDALKFFVQVPTDFDPIKFLARYGARPINNDIQNINNPLLLWMNGWMKFLELWSQRFTANASFTFMPELLPGGLVAFGNRVQMFVESVTHNFDMSSGFTTTAELSSLAALSGSDAFPDLDAPAINFPAQVP
jgi:hypothetical protein